MVRLRPKMRIVFLCVANSARSQLAEGIARHLLGRQHHIESAGSFPGRVHPQAIEVLSEVGIDISRARSKGVGELQPQGIDLIVTLCADEVCPSSFHAKAKLHWPLPDPIVSEDPEASLIKFRALREDLWKRIEALPTQYPELAR